MKNIKLLFIFFFTISILLGFTSCSNFKNPSNSNLKSTEFRQINPEFFKSFNLPFPEGTTFKLNGNKLDFDLPEPYYILGKDINGNFHRSVGGGGGSVTCKCSSGSGCDPIKSGNDYGCLMKEDCNTCTKSTSGITGVDVDLAEICILNPESGFSVDKFSQLDNKMFLPNGFINAEEIVSLVEGLNKSSEQTSITAKKVVLLNAYGYLLPIEVSIESDNTSLYFRSTNDGDTDAGVSCSCEIAGKSCPKESKFTVVWCNSDNCQTCTLSGRIVDKNGNEKKLSVKDGVINLY